MKKLLFVLSIFALVGASSCKKDWTCTCNATGSPAPVTYPINSSTKSQATTACNNDATALNGQGAANWSCSL